MPHILQQKIVDFPTKKDCDAMQKLLTSILNTKQNPAKLIHDMIELTDTISRRANSDALKTQVKEMLLSIHIPAIPEHQLNHEIFAAVLTPLIRRMKEGDTSSFIGPWHLRVISQYHTWLENQISRDPGLCRAPKSFAQYFYLAPLEEMLKIFNQYFSNPPDISPNVLADAKNDYKNTILMLSSIRARTFSIEPYITFDWVNDWIQSFETHYLEPIGPFLEKNKKNFTTADYTDLSFCLSQASKPNADVLIDIFRKLKLSDFFLQQSFDSFCKNNQEIYYAIERMCNLVNQVKAEIDKIKALKEKLKTSTMQGKERLQEGYDKKINECNDTILSSLLMYKCLFCHLIIKLQSISIADPLLQDHKLQDLFRSASSIPNYPSPEELRSFQRLLEVTQLQHGIIKIDNVSIHNKGSVTIKENSVSANAEDDQPCLAPQWYPELVKFEKKLRQIGKSITLQGGLPPFNQKTIPIALYMMKPNQDLFASENKRTLIDYFKSLFSAIAKKVNYTKSSKTLPFKKENLQSVLNAINIALKLKEHEELFLDIRDILLNVPWAIDLSHLYQYLELDQHHLSETLVMFYGKLETHSYRPKDITEFFIQTSNLLFQEKVDLNCVVKSFEILSGIINGFTNHSNLNLGQYLEIMLKLVHAKSGATHSPLLKSIFSIASNIIRIEHNMELNQLTEMAQKLFPLMDNCEPCVQVEHFITILTHALLKFDKESSPIFISTLERIMSQNILDIHLTKLVVQLIDKQKISFLSDQRVNSEYSAFSQLNQNLEHLKELVDHHGSNNFKNMLESAIALFSPDHENSLSYSEQLEIFQTFVSRQERIQEMCDTAMTCHIRTPTFPVNADNMQAITKPAELAQKLDNMFIEFHENIESKNQQLIASEEEKYANLQYLWAKIKLKNRPTIEQILDYLNKKLSSNEKLIELEIAKAHCLYYLDFDLEALEYTNTVIERYQSIHRMQKKMGSLIAFKASCLEKLGRYHEAVICRNKVHTEFLQRAINHNNFLRLIKLYLKIGDNASLQQALTLAEAYQHNQEVPETPINELLVTLYIRLKNYDAAKTIIENSNTLILKIQQGAILCATSRSDEAKDLMIDLVSYERLSMDSLFSFFNLFYQLPSAQKIAVTAYIPELFLTLEEKFPNSKELFKQKIYFYLTSHQHPIAIDELKKYQALYGEDVFYLVSYSSCLRHNKMQQQAIQLLASHPLAKNNYKILLELAICYAEENNYRRVEQIFATLFETVAHHSILRKQARYAFDIMNKGEKLSNLLKKYDLNPVEETEENFSQSQYADVFEETLVINSSETPKISSINSLGFFPSPPHYISNFFNNCNLDYVKYRKLHGRGNRSSDYCIPYTIAALDLAITEETYDQWQEENAQSASYDEVIDSTLQFVIKNKMSSCR